SAHAGLAALVTTQPGRTQRSPPSAHAGLAAPVTTQPGRTQRPPPSAHAALAAPATTQARRSQRPPTSAHAGPAALVTAQPVATPYGQMPGGCSPLNDLTFMQARSLAAMLAGVNLKLPVFVGMRNWKPYLHETLATMGERGVGNALGIILSALRTEASWERYMNDVGEARARTPGAPAVAFAPPFFDHPLFVEAVADRARAALARVPE